MSRPWPDYISGYKTINDSIDMGWAKICLSLKALEDKVTFQEGSSRGKLKVPVEEIKALLSDMGPPISVDNNNNNSNKNYETVMYGWDDSVCQFYNTCSNNNGSFQWGSTNPDTIEKFKAIAKNWEEEEPEGRVFVLIPRNGGLTTQSIGMGAVPLETSNYCPGVIKGYETVVKDIQSPDPLGRLVIFDGPPGTGKTYLIRALLSALPKTKFLLLPSNMADSLTGPELLSVLIDSCGGLDEDDLPPTTKPTEGVVPKKKAATVLVIEDADKCLTNRGGDNISAISAILNLSDGIIGNLLDLRIVCTTNAEMKDIDKALMRTGRLSARIEVTLLDREQAKAVYARLNGAKEQSWDKKFYALSDVYAMVKGLDIDVSSTGKKKATVGFNNG